MLTKGKRRALFYAAILVFLLLLFPIIFYSLGYRLGPDFKLHKTGGFFIKTSEAGAKVSAGNMSKETSFFSKSALLKNMLPGKYEVKAGKNGFWDWTKILEITGETVTNRNALLIPKNIEAKDLGATFPPAEINKPPYPSIKKFWAIPGTNDFLILGNDGNFYKNKNPYDVLGAWGTTTYKILKSGKNSFFDENFSRLIYWDRNLIDAYWFADLDKMPQWEKDSQGLNPNLRIFSLQNSINDVRPYPGWPDYLIVLSGDGIYTMEIDSSGGQNIFPLYRGRTPKIVFLDASLRTLIFSDTAAGSGKKEYFQLDLE